MTVALIAIAAVLIDWQLGEPRRLHPLVGFGRLAIGVEKRFYGSPAVVPTARSLRGVFAVAILLVPFLLAASACAALPGFGAAFSVLALYWALGLRSLHDHARPVAQALCAADEAKARACVSLMVSRDSAALDITAAVTESVLENGNDAVFGVLFWYVVAGAPGAVLYRLANTLDAMWGYRNARYLHFGWAAARLDDVLNYLPARLTALTYAVLGRSRQALVCWGSQARAWDSPNAGPVMAAGAGALGVVIGGPARYSGEWHDRPILGTGNAPTLGDIERALRLVRRGVGLWLAVIGIGDYALG